MAGETENCISFQSDLSRSGSISFGRFEVESLSWERRSSFSHSRYLEEVEKCYTPGSVTQKRAILEAHFKKKPFLMPQASLEHQEEGEYQGTRKHIDQQKDYFEERVDPNNEGHPEFTWYDESPDVSDDHETMEEEEEEEEEEKEEILPLEFPIECTSYTDEKVLHPSSELSDLYQTLQRQAEHHIKPSNKDNLCIVVEPEPDNKAVILEELLEKREDIIVEEVHEDSSVISSRRSIVERKNVHSLKKTQKTFLKVDEAVKQRTAKIKRTQLSVQQNLRNSSIKQRSVTSVAMFSESMDKPERECTLRTRLMKKSPSRTSTVASSDSKNLKLEEEREAETKQFRRSLNFKATPMPSFYHEAVPGVSEGKKVNQKRTSYFIAPIMDLIRVQSV